MFPVDILKRLAGSRDEQYQHKFESYSLRVLDCDGGNANLGTIVVW
jgi:hypothetical protein